MRRGRPSEEQLRRNFESVLATVSAGHGVRSSTGLDEPTKDALWAISRAFPNITEELVTSARQTFAGQLDGSNAARWHEELARKITEYHADSAG